jgi:ABC-2 type transport system permease protein
MAVYKRNYQRYEGTLSPARWRFLVLPRYAFAYLFRSRFFTGFFMICFICPLIAAVLIYLRHNISMITAFKLDVDRLVPIDEKFFLVLLTIQGTLGFILASFVGPGLVAPDLANNALPLYFSRPFSRTEYVLGKMTVLALLLSSVTWLPDLLLFLLQSNLEGTQWLKDNLRIAAALFLGAWIWILTVSLLALALSAWVKWKPVAGALLFGVFFVGAGFGEAINKILYTDWGFLINLGEVIKTVWTWLFFGEAGEVLIPVWSAGLSLLAACGLCLFLLARKIRAYEIVR